MRRDMATLIFLLMLVAMFIGVQVYIGGEDGQEV